MKRGTRRRMGHAWNGDRFIMVRRKSRTRTDKRITADLGLPKAFRQYAKRYGPGIESVALFWKRMGFKVATNIESG